MTVTKVRLDMPEIDGYTPKDVLSVIQRHLASLVGTEIDNTTDLKAQRAVHDAIEEIRLRSPGLALAFDAHGTFEVKAFRLRGRLEIVQPPWFRDWSINSISSEEK